MLGSRLPAARARPTTVGSAIVTPWRSRYAATGRTTRSSRRIASAIRAHATPIPNWLAPEIERADVVAGDERLVERRAFEGSRGTGMGLDAKPLHAVLQSLVLIAWSCQPSRRGGAAARRRGVVPGVG